MINRLSNLLLQRLFWKIFLWFWLAMVVLVCAVAVTIVVSLDPDALREERAHMMVRLAHATKRVERISQHSLMGQLPHSSDRMRMLFESPEPIELLHHRLGLALKGLNTSRLMNQYVFTPQGDSVISETPGLVLKFMHRYGDSPEPVIRHQEGRLLVGPQKVLLAGQPYRVVVSMKPPWLGARVLYASQTHISAVLIAILVSAVFSGLMSASLIRPLRHLRLTAQRIAEGDLEARAGAPLTERKDEFGELGRDFDGMASKLESLVSGQQRLLRDVSHELRSPLTRLQISLALARKKSQGVVDAQLDRSEREIERLNQLIGQVILWSRIDSLGEGEYQSVDLKDLLEEVVEDCDFEAGAQDRRVQFEGDKECWVTGDSTMLRSAFENIIRNAIRFSPQGDIVQVRLRHVENTLVVEVEDRGPGVPEHVLEEMFQPFYRVDETRGQENSGSGLGTAIAKRAVESHGGTVIAKNLSDGFLVKVSLPRE